MRILIGIDDTDTKETRGTGFNARQIGKLIEEQQLGTIEGITRHQLFFDPRIPYTSANSSACLEVECENIQVIKNCCLDYLNRIAPLGSDVGLCIHEKDKLIDQIVDWGNRAKKEVLSQSEGRKIANDSKTYLRGLCGTEDGVIGALAAVGLRKGGNDGRFIWLKGKQELRDIPAGIYNIKELKEELYLDAIESMNGLQIQDSDSIYIDEWIRPVLKNHKKTLIVKQKKDQQNYEWEVAPKEHIKSIS